MIKKILKRSYPLIGIIIFIWIIKDIDFTQAKEMIFTINPFYFLLATSLYFPIMLIKAYRWKIISDTQQIHYSLKDAFLISGSSLLLGLITPGRIGEFSKVIHLKKDNYSTGKAFFGTFLDKLFDLMFTISFGAIALIFLPLSPILSIDYGLLAKWLGLGIFVLLLLSYLLFLKNKKMLYSFISVIIENTKQFTIKKSLYLLLLTVIAWFIYFLSLYLIAISMNIHESIGFLYLAASAVLVQMVTFLPISTLGIGTREVILILLLTPLGITKETIIIFSLLIMMNYLGQFLICFYCWIKKPLI